MVRRLARQRARYRDDPAGENYRVVRVRLRSRIAAKKAALERLERHG